MNSARKLLSPASLGFHHGLVKTLHGTVGTNHEVAAVVQIGNFDEPRHSRPFSRSQRTIVKLGGRVVNDGGTRRRIVYLVAKKPQHGGTLPSALRHTVVLERIHPKLCLLCLRQVHLCSRAIRWELWPMLVIVQVSPKGAMQRTQMSHANHFFRPFPQSPEFGSAQGYQDANDGNGHQQFDQGKSGLIRIRQLRAKGQS